MRDAAPPSIGAVGLPPAAEAMNVNKAFGSTPVLRDVSIAIPQGRARALVGRNGRRQVDARRRTHRAHRARIGNGRIRRRDRARLARRRRLAEPGRLRLPEDDAGPDPVGRREPVPRRPAGSRPLGGLGAPAPRGAARRGTNGTSASTRTRRRRGCGSSSGRSSRSRGRCCRVPDSSSSTSPRRPWRRRRSSGCSGRIERLRADGVTLLYISHHLQEIYEVCDSVTVMRDGRIVAEAPLDAMPKEAVVAAMVGEDLAAHARTAGAPASTTAHPRWRSVDALGLDGASSTRFASASRQASASASRGSAAPARRRWERRSPGSCAPPAGPSRSRARGCRPGTWSAPRRPA